MYWHCENCDKKVNEEFRKKYVESTFHSSLVNSIIRRYNKPNTTTNKIDVLIKKYLKIHFEKFNKFQVILLLKILMPSNQIKYIGIQRSSYRYRLRLPNAFFFSKLKIIKEQLILNYLN